MLFDYLMVILEIIFTLLYIEQQEWNTWTNITIDISENVWSLRYDAIVSVL
jgi:hypothetical protein